MRNILLICHKELKSYFASPIAYLLMAFFALIFGFGFYTATRDFVRFSFQAQMMGQQQPMNVNEQIIRPLLGFASTIALFLVPMISMRLIAAKARPPWSRWPQTAAGRSRDRLQSPRRHHRGRARLLSLPARPSACRRSVRAPSSAARSTASSMVSPTLSSPLLLPWGCCASWASVSVTRASCASRGTQPPLLVAILRARAVCLDIMKCAGYADRPSYAGVG